MIVVGGDVTAVAAEDEGEGEPNPLRPVLLIVFLLFVDDALDLTFSIVGDIFDDHLCCGSTSSSYY
jgi:hypothetical protein